MRRKISVIVVGGLLFTLSVGAQPQYVGNGQFDTDIAGWAFEEYGPGGMMSWDGSMGSPAPGSLRIAATSDGSIHEAVHDGCAPAPHGAAFTIAALGKVEPGSVDTFCSAGLRLYGSETCVGPFRSVGNFPLAYGNDWWPIEGSYQNHTLTPLWVKPVLFLATGNPGSGACNFDNVTLTRIAPPPPIPTLGPFGLMALVVVLSVCGVALVARRSAGG